MIHNYIYTYYICKRRYVFACICLFTAQLEKLRTIFDQIFGGCNAGLATHDYILVVFQIIQS